MRSSPLVLLLLQSIGAAALNAPGSAHAVSPRAMPSLAARLAAHHASRVGPCLGVALAAPAAAAPEIVVGELTLRLRGGKKGTASMGKKGTGGKAHPSYKYNLSYPRISKHSESKRKRYCLKKNPERKGRCKHLRLVNRRFKHGFRTNPPYVGTPA